MKHLKCPGAKLRCKQADDLQMMQKRINKVFVQRTWPQHERIMHNVYIPYHTSHRRNILKCLIELSSLCYGEAHDQDLNLGDHCVCFGFLATCGATPWEGAACICS